MTTLGVLSDIHGNLVALEAVLADLPAVDGLVCAGDVVGYNPWPAACVDEVCERSVPTVQGNHDRAAVTGETGWFNELAAAGIEHARGQLTDDQLAWLEGLPPERTVADGRLKLVHGHPDDPDHYTRQAEVDAGLLGDESVLVMGHTHVQFTSTFESGIVMNPGSVGQPRDGDPKAAYSVVDLDAMTVDERRVSYDIERVERAIADAKLPGRLGERLHLGR